MKERVKGLHCNWTNLTIICCYCIIFVVVNFSGLDGAGKTTILYRLKLGEVVTHIPTIG